MDEIPPFAETAPVAEVREALDLGLRRIRAEIEITKIKHGLKYFHHSASRRADVTGLLARQEAASAALGGAVDIQDLLAQALSVLKDDDRHFQLTPNDRGADLERLALVVRDALGDVQQQVRILRSERSREIAEPLKEQHDELLIAIYRAAQALSVAGEREREFRTKLLELGYAPPSDLLPSPPLGALLALDVEQNFSSQLATYRRWLQARGLIS
jgi:hypothetical protein